uniref:Serine aminopeptidase S33 domain-containing protein n=1 Tax=Brassica oleracea TaxID=3712 RepID=A0A3P6FD06_BRAOL|nr:unnamed protein product [Brassica oleracea]
MASFSFLDRGSVGEDDQKLYEDAKSKDKTLKIYEGMMHSMLFGERDDNIEIVRNDIVSWLSDRCGGDKTQE